MTDRIQKELFQDNWAKIYKINIEVGKRIRKRREALCLTPEAFAAKCLISPALLSLYETGEVRVSSTNLLRLREILDVDLTYFFDFV